jgi:hypothetical protein
MAEQSRTVNVRFVPRRLRRRRHRGHDRQRPVAAGHSERVAAGHSERVGAGQDQPAAVGWEDPVRQMSPAAPRRL